MEKYYSFAGLELAVSTHDAWMYEDDRMLAPFRVSQVTDPHRFNCTFVDELPLPSGELMTVSDRFMIYRDGKTRLRYTGALSGDYSTAYILGVHRDKHHDIMLKSSAFHNQLTPKAVLSAVDVEHLIAGMDGFVLHSSFIDIGGKAILFTAPSGTGKSTQADLWHDLRGARILNGDRSIVRCTDEGFFACGLPFMGSSHYCENVTLPLAGIVYLAQAPETSIRQLKGVEAFCRVWEGINVNIWDKNDLSAIIDTLSHVLSSVPVWYLSCTPDETAVTALDQQLGK